MPYAFFVVGIVLLVASYRNTGGELAGQLKNDFGSGRTGFLPWFTALLVIGSIGYIRPLKPVANSLLVLVVVVLFLANRGIFASINSAVGVNSGTTK